MKKEKTNASKIYDLLKDSKTYLTSEEISLITKVALPIVQSIISETKQVADIAVKKVVTSKPHARAYKLTDGRPAEAIRVAHTKFVHDRRVQLDARNSDPIFLAEERSAALREKIAKIITAIDDCSINKKNDKYIINAKNVDRSTIVDILTDEFTYKYNPVTKSAGSVNIDRIEISL